MDWKEDLSTRLADWGHVVAGLPEIQEEAPVVDRLIEDLRDPVTVMVFGEFNAGKSTFINAFLGDKILKSDIIPTTAVLTKIRYGPVKKLIGHFPDGSTKTFHESSLNGLSAELEGQEKDTRRQLYYLELQHPIERLKNLTIVDTPGLNSGNPLHTRVTEQFMDRADYAIWLFDYRNVGTASEKKELSKLKSYDIHTFGVINGIDQHDEEEEAIEDFVDFQRPRLHGLIDSLNFTSALEALEGKLGNNPELLELSNWSEMEKLFQNIEQNHDEKSKRTFNRLKNHLSTVQQYLSQEKAKVPVPFYKHIIEKFLTDSFPRSVALYNQLTTERRQIAGKLSQIESVFQEPITQVHAMNELIERVYEIENSDEAFNKLEWQQQWNQDCYSPYIDFSLRHNTYQREASYQEVERKALTRQWQTLKVSKYFKKGKLKRFANSILLYNEKNKKLEDDHRFLLKEDQKLKVQFKKFYEGLNDHVWGTYLQYTQTLTLSDQLWKKEWDGQSKELTKVSSEKLDMIDNMLNILNPFQLTIGAFFIESDPSLEPLHEYQECKYVTETIRNLVPLIPVKEFINAKEYLETIEGLEPVSYISSEKAKFQYQSLLECSISPLPLQLSYPIEKEIQAISSKHKQMLAGLMAAAVIGLGIANFDTIMAKINTSPDTEEITTGEESQEAEDVAAAEEGDTLIEEPIHIDFTSWDNDRLTDYVYSLHSHMADEEFPTSFFTEEAWNSYQPVYDEVSLFQDSSIQELTIASALPNELQFQTSESFHVDGEPKEYTQYYTLGVSENGNPIITSFTSEPVVEKLYVNEDDLSQFMVNYREKYMQALNNGDFSHVEQYFVPGSSAYSEIKDYVEKMSAENFYFDFKQIDILSLTRTAPDYYEVNTHEMFIFTDSKNDSTQYDKEKTYTIYLPSEGQFQIESMETTDTKTTELEEETPEVTEETSSNVDETQIQSFMNSYSSDYNQAFNEYDFSYVENYYSADGTEYENAKQFIQTGPESQVQKENVHFNIESIEKADDQHYLVTATSEDNFFYPDGTGNYTKVRTDYLLIVTSEGELYISEIPTAEVIEESKI